MADQHADRDQRDRGHRGDPQAGHEGRQRQRQVDLHEPAGRAVAHALRRLAHVVGHPLQPGEEVPDQDDQRVGDQTDEHGGRREPGEREDEGEHRQRRDRVDDRRQAQHRPGEDPVAPGEQRQREGDQPRRGRRADGQPDVFAQVPQNGRPSCPRRSPGRTMGSALRRGRGPSRPWRNQRSPAGASQEGHPVDATAQSAHPARRATGRDARGRGDPAGGGQQGLRRRHRGRGRARPDLRRRASSRCSSGLPAAARRRR